MSTATEPKADHQTQGEPSTKPFLHIPQVSIHIDVNSVTHKMFEVAEEIEDQLNTARHLSSIVTDCGYNAALANDHHPGDEHLSADAIYNTMQIALDAIKKVESLFEKYRYMHRELTAPKSQLEETINDLDSNQRAALMTAIKNA